MDQQLASTLYTASTWVLPVLLAITLHEASHGFVAHLLGDDTAWRLGRVSFNPLKHIDPFGTILLPGLLLFLHSPFLFGYAKPVPVNFRALKHPRRDMVLVAAAGPGINVALAFAANLGCLALLWRRRGDDVNMRSAWLCSRNDVIGNVAVLVAAAAVAVTASPWPDIAVGLLVAAVFGRSAVQVVRDASRAVAAAR